ncbi:eCIS core domain-containing protein [Anaerocolumna xylanovorans]|uniref:eCIS core domain-containing protein n=1 Tax=Anaerocolumna xylanovorans DSM 12503 TaxID=1121345 RepID=A0A1M7Y3P2_9FIRM|nr:DUF4157 domain-containing protein [Anaerocolumna xylanovorans]SHO46769.1 protein of unknown function [Anaerocolumna xylanovorans DSM 12503]
MAEQEKKAGIPEKIEHRMDLSAENSFNSIQVHYNSDKSAQIEGTAHAYSQSNDIHMAPGREMHLPHEQSHVVQQRTGRPHCSEQIDIGNKENPFSSLDMNHLIGKPLQAACNAQSQLSQRTADFLGQIGIDKNDEISINKDIKKI